MPALFSLWMGYIQHQINPINKPTRAWKPHHSREVWRQGLLSQTLLCRQNVKVSVFGLLMVDDPSLKKSPISDITSAWWETVGIDRDFPTILKIGSQHKRKSPGYSVTTGLY